MRTEQETTLEVEGMACPSCIRDISSLLSKLDGVRKVDVQFDDGIVRVQHDADRAPIANLIETLAGAGYTSKAA